MRFYTNVRKGSKLKVRKFLWLTPTFVEVTGEKLVKLAFAPPPIPNREKKKKELNNKRNVNEFITLGMEAKILEDVSPLNKLNSKMLKL